MGVVEPIGHHELLLLFVQLFLVLLVARGLGELVTRVGMPSVVGELLAGIVVGPSVLGAVAPGLFSTLFPAIEAQFHLLEVVSWIGLLMLLVVTGLEIDLDLIVNRARAAMFVSFTGIVIPFGLGFGLAYLIPERFLAAPGQRLVFSLFLATAMSISAIPVIAKVLLDLNAIHRDVGQIMLASGMIDDTIGWILLSIVAGLARRGVIEIGAVAETVLLLGVFLGLAFTVGRRASRFVVRWVDNRVGGDMAKITTLMVLALGVGSFTHYIGLEAVLGAFVVGILFGQVKRFDHQTRHTFEVFTVGVFAPVFFATAGLRVNLTAMLDADVLVVGAAALAIATVGKLVGAYVGAMASGMSNWEGITIGMGMNARGAMEIIVATIGLSVGVLTDEMYTIIVMIAIVTSVMAPPLLRWSLSKIEISETERDRLERRERRRRSFVGSLTRVLLPTRCSVDAQLAARLLSYLVRGEDVEVTTMYLARDRTQIADPGTNSLYRLGRLFGQGGVRKRRVRADDSVPPRAEATGSVKNNSHRCLDLMEFQLGYAGDTDTRGIVRSVGETSAETTLSEAGKGYDLLALGASEWDPNATDRSSGAAVNEALRNTPCPVLVVSAGEADSRGTIADERAIERILLPTVGADYNRRAAELAFSIAHGRNAVVEIVHIVPSPSADGRRGDGSDGSAAIEIGEDIVGEEAEIGRQLGADVISRVVVSDDEPEAEIVSLAIENGDDLIVMGTSLRRSRRTVLGHRADHVLRNAPCSVAVLGSL